MPLSSMSAELYDYECHQSKHDCAWSSRVLLIASAVWLYCPTVDVACGIKRLGFQGLENLHSENFLCGVKRLGFQSLENLKCHNFLCGAQRLWFLGLEQLQCLRRSCGINIPPFACPRESAVSEFALWHKKDWDFKAWRICSVRISCVAHKEYDFPGLEQLHCLRRSCQSLRCGTKRLGFQGLENLQCQNFLCGTHRIWFSRLGAAAVSKKVVRHQHATIFVS